MASVPPELVAHREWLGQIAPVGLVVSPQVLLTRGVFVDRQRAIVAQTRLAELVVEDDDERPRIDDVLGLFREVLEWPGGLLAGAPGGPALPDALTVALPEYEDRLAPTYALPAPDASDPSVVSGFSRTPDGFGQTVGESWLGLIQVVEQGTDLDKAPSPDKHHAGWRASPHARLERLLRETGVAIGLLFNGSSLRLVYAPRGESSGHLTFRFADLIQTQGRPMAGALCALLGVERVTDLQPEPQRLASLLRESRKYQNEVSTELAGQVLEALWELVRGFQKANEDAKGDLLAEALRESPHDVYGGLLSTLMRLVFILYAEDRTLMPQSDVYQRHYSLSGLFERLRDDQARYPDTMDARYGAWAQLLALFRLIHDGGGHGDLRFPSRHGRLFNPDAYPFLEGRPPGSARQKGLPIDPPRISDGVVYRVLRNLLVLDGERLSYRALDVEQIGSVYEAMMGFALEEAPGPSLALTPKHIVVNLAELLEVPTEERVAWLRERSELKLAGDALAKAGSVDELVAALGKKVSRYTPHVLPVGALYLQPTEERRRSGSHYTPRSLTEPIVRTTFRPLFERLGDAATPEQILDLKVCDPAMGSGAFLVEACRLLADKLVRAWELHRQTPLVPDDEDVWTYARRLVAERCLYGVDKNVFAVDLAKLSLWLATLAKEHPFTFLDHSLRHGDSLVGLSREQIACFNWEVQKQMPLLRALIDERVAEAQRLREQIQGLATSDDVPRKEHLLRDAEDAIADVRLIGDLIVSAFFERDKPKDRQTLRAGYAGQVEQWLSESSATGGGTGLQTRPTLSAIATALREDDHPISPFHWPIEFPEVFTRKNGGFDVFVGNPPFLGGKRISNVLGDTYRDYLAAAWPAATSNVDLCGYFHFRVGDLLTSAGTSGLVSTERLLIGDSKTHCLDVLAGRGTFFEVPRKLDWPGEANVTVTILHFQKGAPGWGRVNTAPSGPARLSLNAGISFVGCAVQGMGFVVSAPELDFLRTEGEGAVVRPFLTAEDLNSTADFSPSRHIIFFAGMSLDEAEKFPRALDIVSRRVKPYRGTVKRKSHRKYWWRYGDWRPGLYASATKLDRVLAVGLTSKSLAFAFVPAGWVFDQTTVVVASNELALFSLLSSRSHLEWALRYGANLGGTPRYNPSRCFETFPLPSELFANEELRRTGRSYDELRMAIMRRQSEGLTKTYNRFHDPDERAAHILKLRELHDAIDRAVLDAYGWTDIQPRCEFILDYEDDEDETPGKASKKRKPWRYRWPDDIRDEVLGRLLELNAERAAADRRPESSSERRPRRRSTRSSKAGPLLD